MFSYEMSFDRIINMKDNTTVKEMVTFKCEHPLHIFPSTDLISILPKGILVDVQTIELKLLEEIEEIKEYKPRKERKIPRKAHWL